MSASAASPLPPLLADNPRLDRWVRFPSPGEVTVSTGRVEIGQGVLTAMRSSTYRPTAFCCRPATPS